MLDVHINVMEATKPEWVGQCIQTVQAAAERATFPVAVHVFPGVPGHVGLARQRGYSAGSHPYVTFVDDDDFVLPDAFEVLRAALEQGPDAVFGREMHLQNGHLSVGRVRHHLDVYRRSITDAFEWPRWRYYQDVAIREMASKMTVIDVEEPLYVHRLLSNSNARLLASSLPAEELRAERGQLA